MAKKGYFPPRRQKRQATPQQPMRKKADPYTLDQNRDNPDVTDYDRSPEAIEHEMPDTRTEWRKDDRTPTGHPSPSPQLVGSEQKRPRLNPKEARRMEAHASRALRIAKVMVPEGAFKRLSVAGREDLLLRMGNDLMGLTDPCMTRILERIEKLQSFAASFNQKLAMEPMAPEMPMEAPAGDMMGEEPMGDEPGGEALDPEVKEYIDEAVEEAVEEAVAEQGLGEPDGDELELAPVEEGMEEFSSFDMPSDDELLGLLDDKAASLRQARDPNHWEDSVQNVEQPSDDYHSQSADYYAPGSNSEKFEEQMDLSNPALDKGAARRRRADGETANPDQGGLNPFEDDEDYHDADSHSYEEKPMGIKFEEQMDLSNPVLDKGGQHPRESSGGEDPFLQQMFVESLQKAHLPVDASGNLDSSIVGTSVGTRGGDGPTVLSDFVQGRREIDASNIVSENGTPTTRVASRQRPQQRRSTRGRRPRQQGQRRQASNQRPRKTGVRSVGGMGRRQASQNPQREIDALQSLWRTEPDVSKVFGN